MVGKVVGKTGGLAIRFVENTTATSILLGLANQTFLGSLLNIGLSIGSLLAIDGMLFAFASVNAVLFILAVLAPPLATASVLPQASWLRSLWMKAVVLIALLPIVTGGVFKAGMAASIWLGQQGHELAARQAELGERTQHLNGTPSTRPSQGFGSSPTVNASIRSNFDGSPQEFQQGFQSMFSDIARHGMDPNLFAAQYPEETAHMTRAYLDHSEEIITARDPLMRACNQGERDPHVQAEHQR